MEQQIAKTMSVREIEEHPQILTDFLKQNQRISLTLEKAEDSDEVRIGMRKIYSERVIRILKAAKEEHSARKAKGYNREDAIQDFKNAQEKISNHLNKNK